jgi:hypothetical protein
MKAEVRDQIVALLAAEMEAYGDNLDALEGQLLSSLKQIGQGALQAVTAAKKGATQAAGGSVPAGAKRGSSATAPRRS